VAAKRNYFQEASTLSVYDEKALGSYVLYRLPHGDRQSAIARHDSDEALQSIAASAPAPAGLTSQVITTTPSLALVTTTDGSYYTAGNGTWR